MKKFIDGLMAFNEKVFPEKEELFTRLSNRQDPSMVLLTCADSRIDPNLVLQAEPGDIFIIRNAGNLVPASPYVGGEIASLEFAVKVLEIPEIVICGHTNCGAMRGLMDAKDGVIPSLPAVSEWLRHAQKTRDIMEADFEDQKRPDNFLDMTAEQNVLVQVENLLTHDFIRERFDKNQLTIRAWMYRIGSGEILNYSRKTKSFESIEPIKKKDEHKQNITLEEIDQSHSLTLS